MNINILSKIADYLGIKYYNYFSSVCKLTYGACKYQRRKIIAVNKICEWWENYKLPQDVGIYNLNNYDVEYLVNIKYINCGINWRNRIINNPKNIYIMMRIYRNKIYVQFNRDEENVHNYRGFIIGHINNYYEFIELTHNDFLICLKRYGMCIDPKTKIIWYKKINKPRRIIGRIDENFNILPFLNMRRVLTKIKPRARGSEGEGK